MRGLPGALGVATNLLADPVRISKFTGSVDDSASEDESQSRTVSPDCAVLLRALEVPRHSMAKDGAHDAISLSQEEVHCKAPATDDHAHEDC